MHRAQRNRSRLAAAAGLAMTAGVALVAAPGAAHAAFPGKNGIIAFTSTQDGGARHIFVASAHGVVDLTGARSSANETQPEFSPDGHELVLTRYDPTHLPNTEIFVMTAAGRNRIALTDTPTGNSDPTWSPDGRRIAFVSARDGEPDIFTMNSDGTDVRRITHDSASESELAWSPKGDRIAFVRVPGGGGDREIYTIHPSGTGLTDISNDPASYDVDPAWSPNGAKLVYAAGGHPTGSVGGDLWTMNADGTGQAPLDHEDNDYSDGSYPAWSPDGTMIAFAANDGSGYEHVWAVSAAGGENVPVVSNQSDGNPSDQEVDWQQGPSTIAPPRTRITDSAVSSKRHRATFRFTAVGALAYQCSMRKVHRAPVFSRCSAPRAYQHLVHGSYRFEVRAIGPGGTDRTPAVQRFTIHKSGS